MLLLYSCRFWQRAPLGLPRIARRGTGGRQSIWTRISNRAPAREGARLIAGMLKDKCKYQARKQPIKGSVCGSFCRVCDMHRICRTKSSCGK